MKSGPLIYFEEFCIAKTEAPVASSVTVEKAAVVQMLHPKDARTFSKYELNVFILYIMLKLHNATHLDLVWDRYVKDSLEGMAMSKSGRGVYR